MRDFVAKFNKTIHKIPTVKRPSDENHKGFFVNAMSPDISFHLRRNRVTNVEATQWLAIEIEDELLAIGKWKKEMQAAKSQPSSSEKSDLLVSKAH